MFTATLIGEGIAAARISAVPARIVAAQTVAMGQIVGYAESQIRGNASGRPGPRVITGDYRRSINGRIAEVGPGGVVGEIGTNAAQARRLEYGFFGPDSLGRQYRQPPYPHFQPALGDIARFAEERAAAALRGELAA